LGEIARELDKAEQKALNNSSWNPNQSENMDDSGFFSVSVRHWSLWANSLVLIT
jgi:hypothetical protein